MPRRDRLGRHPHRQAAAVAQRDLVLPPVLHPVAGFRDLVTAGLVMLVRHRNHRPRCWRQVHHPTPATYPCRTLTICAPTPVPGGLAFADFRGYEDWEVIAVSQNGDKLALIVGNPAMIEAYKAGIPGNGKPFPDGARMAKTHWVAKKREDQPGE